MARIKGGMNARKKHNRVLKLAKGYRGARSKQYRVAKQSVMRALASSYAGRKQRKRDFRSLWIDLPYDFLKACDSLKDGGNTDVIETDSGFYVGHMVTVSDADATATEKNTLAEEKKQKYYQKVLDGFEAKSTWKVNKKLWKQVRFIDRFKGSAFDKSSGTTSGTVSDGN